MNAKLVLNNVAKVAVVIPVHNRIKEVLKCLKRLQSINKPDILISIIVVDDGSSDGTKQAIEDRYPDVIILRGNGNLWWTGATKLGVNYSISHGCDYILTLNDDVEFRDDFLEELLKTGRSNDNSIICSVVCDTDNRDNIISAGRYAKGFLGYDYGGYLAGEKISLLPGEEYKSDVESGYAMLIPRKAFEELNFDEKTFPHHMGDMDFVLRAGEKGFKVIINPRSFLYTKVGENYFHNQICNKSLWHNLKMFFNIKSTVNIKTRWFFYLRHTPYSLGWISFAYFMVRMCAALLMKVLLPEDMLGRIMKKRTLDMQARHSK